MKQIVPYALLLLVLLHGRGVLYAQNERTDADKINSVLQKLSEAKDDSTKVTLLNTVSNIYRTIKPTKGIEYGNQALSLAQKLNWKKGIADASFALCNNYLSNHNYTSAINCIEKAENLYKESGDKKGLSNALISRGDISKDKDKYTEAEEYYNKADSIKERLKDNNGKANCMARIGSLYELRGNYPKSLEYDLDALAIFDKSGEKSGMAENLQNIGDIYKKLKDYSNAQSYYTRALNVNEQIGNKSGVAACLEKSGTLYCIEGNYSKALVWYNKASGMYKDEIGDKLGEARILMEIGNTYTIQGNYPRALGYDFTALENLKELNNKTEIANCMTNIGTTYKHIANSTTIIKPDEYVPEGRDAQQKKALAYVDTAVLLDREVGDLDGLALAYSERSEIEEMMSNYAEANESYKQYVIFHDSLYNNENTKKEAEKEAEFEHKGIEDSLKEKKALADEELSKETLLSEMQHSMDSAKIKIDSVSLQNKQASLEIHQGREEELREKSRTQEKTIELKTASIRQQQLISYFYIGGIAALILISFFVYRSFSVQKKLNKVITELISEREKTIEIRTAELRISNEKLIELIQFNAHNIREPLTRVMGVMMLREYIPDEEFLENYWQMIEKSVNDLDNTIKQVIFSAENSTNIPGK